LSCALGRGNHIVANTIFDTTEGVKKLQFGIHLSTQAFGEAIQTDQGSAANRFGDVFEQTCHRLPRAEMLPLVYHTKRRSAFLGLTKGSRARNGECNWEGNYVRTRYLSSAS